MQAGQEVLGEAEGDVEVVCAMEVACHTQGAGLSENKSSVHAMKVYPRKLKSELSGDKELASKDEIDYCQVYFPTPTSTNCKRKRDGDTWLEASRNPVGRTRWP